MQATSKPIERAVRGDGWTPLRRRRFTDALASGRNVRRACADVGLSREGAYKLRRRDPVFAGEWQAALLAAQEAADDAFLAGLPENLRRTMSALSGL